MPGESPVAFALDEERTLNVNLGTTDPGLHATIWQALEAWTSVTGIQFRETDKEEETDIMFTDQETGAHARLLAAGFGTDRPFGEVNVPASFLASYGTNFDSQTFFAMVHEIGHALGLGHPGPYNGTAFFGKDNAYRIDSYQATLMSYFRQDENTLINDSRAYPVTPMIADIIAIQSLYGGPEHAHPGDTTFGVDSNIDGYLGEYFRMWTGQDDPFTGLDLYDDPEPGQAPPTLRPVFFDMDHDGRPDLVFEDFTQQVRVIPDTGSGAPDFRQENMYTLALQPEMVWYQSPVFADMDGDNREDLVVLRVYDGAVMWFRNTGAPGKDAFSGAPQALLGIPALGVEHWGGITVTDLNGDGRDDLVAGSADGGLRYFEQGTGGGGVRFTEKTGQESPLGDVWPGRPRRPGDPDGYVTPVFEDIDGDGLEDLVTVNKHGVFRYFERNAGDMVPAFVERTGADNPFAVIQAYEGWYLGGFVFADLDNDNDPDLVLGTQAGKLIYYMNKGADGDGGAPVFAKQVFSNPTALTLYDTDGTDTLDLRTDRSDQRVNLYEEGISSVYGLTGNLVIARETVIERYIAGHGHDDITGNRVANRIEGRDGNDRIWGAQGDDRLYGGAGDDRLYGGPGNDRLAGGPGTDTFILTPDNAGFEDTVLDFTKPGDKIELHNPGSETPLTFPELEKRIETTETATRIDLTDYGVGALVLDGFAGVLEESDFTLVA